jgi:hypothetical protein
MRSQFVTVCHLFAIVSGTSEAVFTLIDGTEGFMISENNTTMFNKLLFAACLLITTVFGSGVTVFNLTETSIPFLLRIQSSYNVMMLIANANIDIVLSCLFS